VLLFLIVVKDVSKILYLFLINLIFLIWTYNIIVTKKIIMVGMVVGSFAGSYIPLIWGDSAFSMSSLLFGALGGFIGIWAGYKVADWV
jgi:hypothetical protein